MLEIRITLMRIRIWLFTSVRIQIRLSLWCGSGSGFLSNANPYQDFFAAVRILMKVMQICYTGLQTLHGSIVGLHGSNVSLSGFIESLQRSRLFTLMRKRVRPPKMMRIQIRKLVWRTRLVSSCLVRLLSMSVTASVKTPPSSYQILPAYDLKTAQMYCSQLISISASIVKQYD